MKISELFYSIQGEGKLVGVPSVFIRVSGCNLRCAWCDTPYASWTPEGREYSVGELVGYAGEQGGGVRGSRAHVVVTGGEPFVFEEIKELTGALRSAGHHVTIETAGTIYRPFSADLLSISPKLSNSTPWEREGGKFALAHEKNRINVPVLRRLIESMRAGGGEGDYQLKFVVSREEDLGEIEALVEAIGEVKEGDVLLMPEGTDLETLRSRAGWVSEVCKRKGYRYCPRLHVELYGNRRGT